MKRSETTIRYTCCSFHCLNVCVLKVWITGDRIVRCEPDDTINAGVPREDGNLPERVLDAGMVAARPCAKGYAQALDIYDPRRLKYPMRRVGRRGEGRLERISWDEALDTIAQKMVQTNRNYGPFSILHHPYSILGQCSLPLAPWFGAGVAGWAAHSRNGSAEPQYWVIGTESSKIDELKALQGLGNIFDSKLVVLWGLNPLATFGGGWAHELLRAKERGIPVVCIESRYSPSAEVLADQWIPIRPTTDVAMMVAMANVWFKEDLCDNEFVAKWVEPDGLRRWKAYVLGADGVDKTPQWAEQICGVPAETIAEFARLFARSKPVNLNVSLSMGRQFYGENPVRASMYLQALNGSACTPGGTAACETGLFVGQPAGPMPIVDWQRKPGTYKAPVLLAAYKWPKAINLREKLDRGEISKEEYNASIGNVAGNPAPNIQMVILESNNHANNLPDVNGTIEALKKVDFVLVSAQYADLPSARYADILLPQIYFSFEGRTGGWYWPLFVRGLNEASNLFIYRQKCVDPPGEVKPNDWVWTQVAKRLGLAHEYNPRMAGVPDEQWDEAVEAIHQEAYETWRARDDIRELGPPSWEAFQKKPVFRSEIKDKHYPFKKDIDNGRNPFRGTASGKIEFSSSLLDHDPDWLATHDYPPGSGDCYGGGTLSATAEMTLGGKGTFFSPDTHKYPLLMSSPHSLYRIHSMLDNNPWLRGDCYRHAVWISAADAKARRIVDGDLVRVFNDVGEMIISAYVTSRVVPGTVMVFHGGWYRPGSETSQSMPEGIDTGGAPNLLIRDEDLPARIIGMLPCKGLVRIEKWEARRE